MRSVANSRERWATVIESVLRITNAPTNSAMPPKPSRKYVMNFRPSLTFLASALAAASPVWTTRPLPSSGLMSLVTAAGETPSLALTETLSNCPALSKIVWAVLTSKTASEVPPRLSIEPNVATPWTV